jgi:hypothetical protein
MATRLNIEIVDFPLPFATVAFTLANVDLGYSKTISKQFIEGVPTNSNQIQIKETLAEIIVDLATNIAENDLDGNIFLLNDIDTIADNFTLDFTTPETYVLSATQTAMGAFVFDLRTYEAPGPVPEPETFDLLHFSIRIKDTYDNDRELIVERTRKTAPKLIYEGGDDIISPLMTSELKFDMRVDSGADAHFLHLFSGDENRFRVELYGIDINENEQLLWQGFLLPDLYREPYVKGNLFVEFSATDLLGTLKGKFFKPWEYQRKINIMRLFAEIMKQTGLEQPFVVLPSLLPALNTIKWWHINIDIAFYFNGRKGSDLYKILTELLQSNLITLYSYRGIWHMEGVHRKTRTSDIGLQFDADGVYQSQVVISREVKNYEFVKGSLWLNAISPYKEVTVNYADKGSSSLYPEDIVIREAFFGTWEDDSWDETTQKTSYIDYWQKVGALNLEFKNANHKFSYGTIGQPGNGYVVTEQVALVNYFKCKFLPFIIKNTRYRLKITLELSGIFFPLASPSWITNIGIPEGHFDNFILYQLLLNGSEVLSNRSGFGQQLENIFFKQYDSTISENYHVLKFVLDAALEFDSDGYLDLRFLAPVSKTQFGNGLADGRLMSRFQVDLKKIELVLEDDLDPKLIGTRDINYTTSLDLDIPMISSIGDGLDYNFGLGMQLEPYQIDVPVGTQTYVENTHTFNSNAINKIFSWRFQITPQIEDLFFKQLKKKASFLTRLNGYQEFFNFIYTKRLNTGVFSNAPFLYYLTERLGNPKIPKDYKYLAKIESGETLTVLLSEYPDEDLNQRLRWKIQGETEVEPFVYCLVNLLHYIRPEQFYAIEGTMLGLVFPGDVIEKEFDGEIKNFVSSRLEIDLVNGKTSITAREMKYEKLTDISYE